jgi:uncharacterized protein involved in high-affinity Fe2+ transport
MKKINQAFLLFAMTLLSLNAKAADFREYPVGDPVEKNKLLIAAVYFPAVPMDHSTMNHAGGPGHLMSLSEKDIAKEKFAKPGTELIHLEADIHATKENPNGFAAGEWIPYLDIHYELIKAGEKKAALTGEFMPMVAKDGPHYGTTLRMPGKGKYKLKYRISSPQLARHSDKLTGVAEYWKSFEVEYDFEYDGLPK